MSALLCGYKPAYEIVASDYRQTDYLLEAEVPYLSTCWIIRLPTRSLAFSSPVDVGSRPGGGLLSPFATQTFWNFCTNLYDRVSEPSKCLQRRSVWEFVWEPFSFLSVLRKSDHIISCDSHRNWKQNPSSNWTSPRTTTVSSLNVFMDFNHKMLHINIENTSHITENKSSRPHLKYLRTLLQESDFNLC